MAAYIGLGGLVALAVGLSLLRLWLLPRIDDFRDPIADKLGTLLGETLRIEQVSARLQGFHPELSLHGLHILDAQSQTAIRFATARASLDPFRSLAAREPRFNRIDIIGPHLALRRRLDGTLAILGLSAREGDTPAWLLADGEFDLRDAELDYRDERNASTTPLFLGKVDLRLRNTRNRHRFSAELELPETLGQGLRLIADIKGQGLDPTGWRGRVYLQGQGLDAAHLAHHLPHSPLGLLAGKLDTQLWLDWQGAPRSLQGEFSLHEPVLFHTSDQGEQRQFALPALSAHVQWRPAADGWRLDFDHWRPVLNTPWPDTRLALAVRQDGIAAAASYLNLGDIANAVSALAPEIAPHLHSQAPRGVLEHARLFYAPQRADGERLGVAGRFREVALKGGQGLPGFSNLSGEFSGTDTTGNATLALTQSRLALEGLGMPPIPLPELRTSLTWAHHDQDWTLTLPLLRFRTPDFSALGRVRVVLAPKASPFLDLQLHSDGMDVLAVPRYLPCALIPDTCQWAHQALLAGRVTGWDFLFHGHSADFPFYRQEGVLQAAVGTENIKLRFSPDWLPLTQAAAQLWFEGPGLTIDAHQGRIGAGEVVQVHALIPDLNRDPVLELTGTARASVADSLDFLAHSPLRNIPERLLRYIDVSGTADIDMHLRVPFDTRRGDTLAQGTAHLHKAGLRNQALALGISSIDGDLHFNGQGIHAPNLQARFLDQPATLQVRQQHADVVIDLRGKAEASALARQFPAEAWRHVHGMSSYHATLNLPKSLDAKSGPLRLALESDLVGMALDLPDPLGKPDTSARPLRIDTQFRAGDKLPVKLSYGREVALQARFTDPDQGLRLESADLAVGEPLPTSGEPGLGLYLRLDTLDAGAWWRGEADASETSPPPVRELKAKIGKLAWNGEAIGALSLQVRREGEHWTGHIDSDPAQGRFTASADAIHLDLDRLRFPKRPERPKPAPNATPPSPHPDIDPARVPSLYIKVKELRWDRAALGTLALNSERRAHGMIVKALTLDHPNHHLKLQGHWTRSPSRDPDTRLEGSLHIASLGEFLTSLGYGGKVRDTASDLNFRLNWPGSPRQFAAATVAGEVTLKLGKGALPKIEPGLGRMIGMLNLNSLWRRLNLDFSDLFGEGLAYDGMGGTFRLGGGQALTEGFLIDALSAKMVIGGKVGLAAHDLDQVVTVIPHTSVALPIAGVVAGGPAVGAAVLVAQRLVGEEVDNLVASHYAVQGSWDAPTITRVDHNLPLDMLDRAWTGVKDLSGLGTPPPPPQPAQK